MFSTPGNHKCLAYADFGCPGHCPDTNNRNLLRCQATHWTTHGHADIGHPAANRCGLPAPSLLGWRPLLLSWQLLIGWRPACLCFFVFETWPADRPCYIFAVSKKGLANKMYFAFLLGLLYFMFFVHSFAGAWRILECFPWSLCCGLHNMDVVPWVHFVERCGR